MADLQKEDIKKEIENIKKKAEAENKDQKQDKIKLKGDFEKENENKLKNEETNIAENEYKEKELESEIKTESKKIKNRKNKEDKKMPGKAIDKILNWIIIILLIIILGLCSYFGYQIFNTKTSSLPKIEENIKKYKEKENYTYIVSEENTETKKSKNIKVSKVKDFIQVQIRDNDDSFAVIKYNNKDIIYLIKDSDIKKLEDITTEEYKKYLNILKDDYLNIKKYLPNSLIALKDSNNIVLSKGNNIRLQFDAKTYMPSVFVDKNKKISFEFPNEEGKLIIPYLESQIEMENKKAKANNEK